MEPIVLVHGYPFDGTLWDPVRPGLIRAGLQPFAPDLPGFGRTDTVQVGAPTVDDYAQALLAEADRAGLTRFVLAGHSFGGYVALALAAAAPQRVLGLGLVSTRTGADSDETRKARQGMVERIRAEGTGFLGPMMIPKMTGKANAERIAPVLEPFYARARPDGCVAALHAMASRPDRTRLLAAWTKPLAVIHGGDDSVIPPAEAEAMAKTAPGATLTVVPGAAHVPMLEAPDAVAAALGALRREGTA